MRNMQPNRPLITTIFALVLLLSYVESGVRAQSGTPVSDQSPVKLVFVNALAALAKVDVYLNGNESEQRVIEGLEYGATSKEIAGTDPGSVIIIRQFRLKHLVWVRFVVSPVDQVCIDLGATPGALIEP